LKTLTIGAVAKLSGLTVETIRYYESQKLLERPHRSVSGYRQYSVDAIRRLNFISNAKSLGFSLAEVRDLLQLRTKTIASCAGVKERADIKIKVIEQKIHELQRLQNALTALSVSCSKSNRLDGKCPILELLEQDEGRNEDES
jgi:DNA-binding transcriptional MerR regulator